MIQLYASGGWEADRAALESIVKARAPADVDLVGKVVKALYAPWLDQTARNFQKLVSANEANFRALAKPVDGEHGACVLFADGLGSTSEEWCKRFWRRGAQVCVAHRIAPLPTVTATGKPLASPAHAMFEGTTSTEDFSQSFLPQSNL